MDTSDDVTWDRATAVVLGPEAGLVSRLSQLLEEQRLATISITEVGLALRCLERATTDVVVVDLATPEPSQALVRAIDARTDAPIVGFGRAHEVDARLSSAGVDRLVTTDGGIRPVSWAVGEVLGERASAQGQRSVGATAPLDAHGDRDADLDADPGTPPAVDEDLVVDLVRGEARFRGVPLDLTPLQVRLLATLAAAEGEVVRNAELHRALFGDRAYRSEQLATQVLKLRTQLARAGAHHECVAWVAGVGYRLVVDAD